MMIPFPNKKYDIIYADPPWPGKYWRGETDFYPEMSMEDIYALPVSDISAENAYCFLWVIDGILPACLLTLKHWGFEYRKSFIWDKMIISMGYYNRGQHEQLLMGSKGKPMQMSVPVPSSIIRCKRGAHSVKPVQIRERISKMFPTQSKIELFARPNWTDYDRGWDFWGNEVSAEGEL